MKRITYQQQLNHPKWIELTKKMKEKEGWKCQKCSAVDKPLHLHHSCYVKGRLIWEYAEELLKVLCEDCHKYLHWEIEHAKDMLQIGLDYKKDFEQQEREIAEARRQGWDWDYRNCCPQNKFGLAEQCTQCGLIHENWSHGEDTECPNCYGHMNNGKVLTLEEILKRREEIS